METKASVTPLPNSCKECPFYHQPNPSNEGTWYEHWDCFLKPLKDRDGNLIRRPKECPLKSEN